MHPRLRLGLERLKRVTRDQGRKGERSGSEGRIKGVKERGEKGGEEGLFIKMGKIVNK